MFYVAVGILIIGGLAVMLLNFVERPTNDGGKTESGNRQWRDWNPPWPPENERLSHQMRKWWEL